MASIKLQEITKGFKKDIAINDVSLEVKDKEFFIIFGPAGAGKTTLLNIIAGIYLPDNGEVFIDNHPMHDVEPEDRDVAMVFEDYALYPHLSVYDNIASPLRSPKYRKPEDVIKKEVTRVAKTLKIDWLLERNPSELSNGQRQRVGLGRALVRSPKVFLMDEPITHLDAKLRHQMRAELKDMQYNLDTTTIYVTHDYLEALSLGDRIAVINEGKIEQIGTPEEIYHKPANEFVASAFGEPEINMLNCTVITNGNDRLLKIFNQKNAYTTSEKVERILKSTADQHVRVGFRPKDIQYSFEKINVESVKGSIYSIEPLGAKAILTVKVEENIMHLVIPSELVLELNLEQDIYINLDLEKGIFFDADTRENLLTTGYKKERRGFAWQS